MKAIGLFIAILGITLLGAEAHAQYDPQMCSRALQDAGLQPFEPRLSMPSRIWGEMYTPFQGVICRNANTSEVRLFPPSTEILQCTLLHASDLNWGLANAYNCVGGAPP